MWLKQLIEPDKDMLMKDWNGSIISTEIGGSHLLRASPSDLAKVSGFGSSLRILQYMKRKIKKKDSDQNLEFKEKI